MASSYRLAANASLPRCFHAVASSVLGLLVVLDMMRDGLKRKRGDASRCCAAPRCPAAARVRDACRIRRISGGRRCLLEHRRGHLSWKGAIRGYGEYVNKESRSCVSSDSANCLGPAAQCKCQFSRVFLSLSSPPVSLPLPCRFLKTERVVHYVVGGARAVLIGRVAHYHKCVHFVARQGRKSGAREAVLVRHQRVVQLAHHERRGGQCSVERVFSV
eukprot:ctg_1576.g504